MDKQNLPGSQPEQKMDGMSRRQALAALGKLAIYTAPVLTTLTMKVDNAKAQIGSGVTPPGPPPV